MSLLNVGRVFSRATGVEKSNYGLNNGAMEIFKQILRTRSHVHSQSYDTTCLLALPSLLASSHLAVIPFLNIVSRSSLVYIHTSLHGRKKFPDSMHI